MARVTLVYGLLMIVLGVGMYFWTGAEHITALIPAFFGGVFLVLGLLALKDNLRKHAMHAAAALALLAFLAAAGRLIGQTEWRSATTAQAAMALLSAAYVALGVRSFRQARLARTQAQHDP